MFHRLCPAQLQNAESAISSFQFLYAFRFKEGVKNIQKSQVGEGCKTWGNLAVNSKIFNKFYVKPEITILFIKKNLNFIFSIYNYFLHKANNF